MKAAATEIYLFQLTLRIPTEMKDDEIAESHHAIFMHLDRFLFR